METNSTIVLLCNPKIKYHLKQLVLGPPQNTGSISRPAEPIWAGVFSDFAIALQVTNIDQSKGWEPNILDNKSKLMY